MTPWLTDAEVQQACEGLTQPAAQIRHLRRLGLRVDVKPNGRPLVWRPEALAAGADPAQNSQPQGMNVVGLQQWAARRKITQ
jgi:hypothetical protein